jgi:hypothetical protein
MLLFKLICRVLLPVVVLGLFIIYPLIVNKGLLPAISSTEWVWRIVFTASYSYFYWQAPNVVADSSWFGKLDKTGKIVLYSNPRIHKLAYFLNAIGGGILFAVMIYMTIGNLLPPPLYNAKLPIALAHGAFVMITTLIGMRTLGEKKVDAQGKSA